MHVAEIRAVLHGRDLRRLWVAKVASSVGDWAARLALTVLVYQRTHSATMVGLVTVASLLPWVGLGQVLATLGDRLPRRHVMVASDLLRAVLFAAMAFPMPAGVVLVLAFFAACATPPFEAARSALARAVTEDASYPGFLRVSALTEQLAVVAGYLAGGGLVTAIGARGAVLFNAGSFLVSALLVVGMTEPRLATVVSSASSRLRLAARVIVGDSAIVRAVVLTMAAVFAGTAGEALVAVYAATELHAGAGVAGLLAASVAVTTMGTCLVLSTHASPERLLTVASAVGAVGALVAVLGFVTDGGLFAAVVAFAGLGIVFAVGLPTNVVVGTRLPDNVRASAFGLLAGSLMAAQLAGAAVGGVLSAAVGVRPACTIAVLPLALATGYLLLTRRRVPTGPALADLTDSRTPEPVRPTRPVTTARTASP